MSMILAALLWAAPLEVKVPCEGYTLLFTSPSGEPTEDDGRVEVEVDGARFPIPFRPAMFTHSPARVPSPRLRCAAQVPALEVRPGLLVLMFTRSGRPHLDPVSFALVDLRARRTLAVVETPHALASGRVERDGRVELGFVHREVDGGFDVRVVREWLPGTDGPEGAIEDWLAVRVAGARLRVGWLRR